jgi:folylpolyglutamate synthase/dihydropteroate synthase
LAPEDRVEVLVTGSLHLVGGVIEVLESERETNQ